MQIYHVINIGRNDPLQSAARLTILLQVCCNTTAEHTRDDKMRTTEDSNGAYKILSAFCMVESLCAMTSTVWLFIILSRASCTTASLSASKAEVASSSNSTVGLRTRARAIAIRCFWPPDRATPLSPHSYKPTTKSRIQVMLPLWSDCLTTDTSMHRTECRT